MVLITALAAIAVVACGGDEPAAPPATVAPTLAPEPTATVEPTATAEPVAQIIDDPVVPAVEPEAGSREAMVLAAFKGQTSAINHQDWDAWVTFCDPTLPFPPTVDEITFLYSEYSVRYVPLPSEPDLAGYNMKNVTVKFYGEDTASTAGDIYNYDELLQVDVHDLWIKIDETWYADSFYCKGPSGKNRK